MVISAELKNMIDKLGEDLKLFSDENNLEAQLESAVKHIPAYIKIIKSHLGQLNSVLQLDNHNRRNIDSVNLARPVRQLIEMFELMADEDILVIEELHSIAKNWNIDEDEINTNIQGLIPEHEAV